MESKIPVQKSNDAPDVETFLAMDPESGFVDVCMRHGDLVRPLQCDEIAVEDNRSLAELFSRNFFVDTPDGPVALSADDWMSELEGGVVVPRDRPMN